MKELMKIFSKLIISLFILVGLFISSLHANEDIPVKLQLSAGGSEDGKSVAGLILDISNEWHAYAPSPENKEAAGFEPTLNWHNSENLSHVEVIWPQPIETEFQGQLSYVYEKSALVKLLLTPIDKSKPVNLKLDVSLLLCSSMCLPVDEQLTLTIHPEQPASPAFTEAEEEETSQKMSSFLILLMIAFLGGFILNFMPCVLPVLSLKVISLIKQSKKDHIAKAKQGFFITGIGIIASFLILATITILLKESGEAFGWGIHFQNPHFLLFVFLVLIAFAASLLGVFEIDLPSGIGSWLVSHEGKGRVKDFLSGVFATLLATPCSAPFVGTALSFALAHQAIEILWVFFFLGLGFAFPYILVASLPQRYIYLPKPGKWMLWMQIFLGIGLAATALWIGWILSFHLPLWTLLLSTALVLIALSFFWIKHHIKPNLHAWFLALPFFAIAWSLSWVAEPSEQKNLNQIKEGSPILDVWKPFNPDLIPELIKQDKIVFIDATAEWCVTCSVNKSLVLNDPKVTKILSNPQVVAMKADWTKQDAEITKFLQKHKRFGIPFNIVFGPKNANGIVLPEILSVSTVLEAFKEVGFEKPSSEPVE